MPTIRYYEVTGEPQKALLRGLIERKRNFYKQVTTPLRRKLKALGKQFGVEELSRLDKSYICSGSLDRQSYFFTFKGEPPKNTKTFKKSKHPMRVDMANGKTKFVEVYSLSARAKKELEEAVDVAIRQYPCKDDVAKVFGMKETLYFEGLSCWHPIGTWGTCPIDDSRLLIALIGGDTEPKIPGLTRLSDIEWETFHEDKRKKKSSV